MWDKKDEGNKVQHTTNAGAEQVEICDSQKRVELQGCLENCENLLRKIGK